MGRFDSCSTLVITIVLSLAVVSEGQQKANEAARTGLRPDSASIEQFIAQRITVAESKNIFTVFAFLNLAGYDDENNKEGMHPVRKLVREQVAKLTPAPLQKRIRSFYKDHPVDSPYSAYAVVATATSGPPEFKFSPSWSEIANQAPFRDIQEMPSLLREFYAAIPIDKVYERVRNDYESAISAQRAAIVREVSRVMEYCRVGGVSELVGEGEVKKAVVIPNLLESYERATSFVWEDTFISLQGPQPHPGYNPHEFVHSITNPLSYDPKYRNQRERAQGLLVTARRMPEAASDAENLEKYFDENLVRAISLKYLDTGDAARAERLRAKMLEEYRTGYILERFFYEQLSGYEKSGQSLRLYYPQMLARLDPEQELDRWKAETTKPAH